MALDLTGNPAPPPRKTANETRATVRRNAKTAERQEAVNGLFQIGATLLVATKNLPDAAAVAEHGDNIARETALLAENNEKFAKVIDYITAFGPYAGLLTACVPLMLQIAVNHKKLPAEALSQFGVVSPETLTAKLTANAAKQQAQMLEEAREAERQAAEAMARLSKAGEAA